MTAAALTSEVRNGVPSDFPARSSVAMTGNPSPPSEPIIRNVTAERPSGRFPPRRIAPNHVTRHAFSRTRDRAFRAFDPVRRMRGVD